MLLRDPRNANALLLDRYARAAEVLRMVEPAHGEIRTADGFTARDVDAARTFLSKLDLAEDTTSHYDVTVTVLCGNAGPSRYADVLGRLSRAFPDAQRFEIRLHLPDASYPFWDWVLPFCNGLWPTLSSYPSREHRFSVEGTFQHGPTEEVANSVVTNGVRLRHVVDDEIYGGAPDREKELATVVGLAELGLRVPLLAYLHDGNRAEIAERFGAMLDDTYHAGFLTRTIQEHPEFGTRIRVPAIGADAYLPIVAELYRSHPYYDDVLEPMSTAIQRLTEAPRIKRRYRLVIDAGMRVGIYRKASSAAEPLTSTKPDEIAREVRDWYVSFERAARECGTCQLWHLCGGVDRVGDGLAAICDTWKFMLPAVLLEEFDVVRLEAKKRAMASVREEHA